MSSVRTWERKEHELNLFVEAQEFSIYMLKATKNEKIFKPLFKTEITDQLNKLSMDIYLNLWKANHYKIGTKERSEHQHLVIENCIDFLAIWNLGIRAFHLKHKKTNYVVGKVVAIRDTTKKWIQNDIERLKDLANKENEVV